MGVLFESGLVEGARWFCFLQKTLTAKIAEVALRALREILFYSGFTFLGGEMHGSFALLRMTSGWFALGFRLGFLVGVLFDFDEDGFQVRAFAKVLGALLFRDFIEEVSGLRVLGRGFGVVP